MVCVYASTVEMFDNDDVYGVMELGTMKILTQKDWMAEYAMWVDKSFDHVDPEMKFVLPPAQPEIEDSKINGEPFLILSDLSVLQQPQFYFTK